jgi:hypothetical protein
VCEGGNAKGKRFAGYAAPPLPPFLATFWGAPKSGYFSSFSLIKKLFKKSLREEKTIH